jgi:hypothetical protein
MEMYRGRLLSLTMATAFVATAFVATTSPALAGEPTEANLRAADAEQLRVIVKEDAKAQDAFMHPNYIINGPANVVKRKADVVAMLARGDIASDSFTRKIEGVALTGNVGIVMGSEVVKPSPGSELGRRHPGKTLNRRFTNVFLWEQDKWRFLARQATIVSP